MGQTVSFRQAFWRHYADRHPRTPNAQRFQEDYRHHSPSYKIDEADLSIRHYLGTDGVGTYVVGGNDEVSKAVERRIRRYWERFQEKFEDITYYIPNEKGLDHWCETICEPEGGTRNRNNWDALTDWMEDQRRKYMDILRP
jgi:hypothetical protein